MLSVNALYSANIDSLPLIKFSLSYTTNCLDIFNAPIPWRIVHKTATIAVPYYTLSDSSSITCVLNLDTPYKSYTASVYLLACIKFTM